MESSLKQMDGAGDSSRNSQSTSQLSEEQRQTLRNIKSEKGLTAAAAGRKKQEEDQKKADDAAAAAAKKKQEEDQKKADDAAAAAAKKKQEEDQKKADDAVAAAAKKKQEEDQKKPDDAAAAAAKKKQEEDQKKADDAVAAAAKKKQEEDKKKVDDAVAAAAKKKQEDDEKKTDDAAVTVKVQTDMTLAQLPYDFVDGLPVWTEREIPKNKLGPIPPGWDVLNWEVHLTKRYNANRKKNYEKLLQSCKRKKEREAEEKLQKERAEREERERQENIRKEEEKRQREKMEKDAEAILDEHFEMSWNLLDIIISNDEDASPKPNGNEDKETPTVSDDNQNNGKDDEPTGVPGETVNGKPIKTEPIDPEIADNAGIGRRQPLGISVEEGESETEKSEKSMESATGTPRSSMRLRSKAIAARQSDAAQFSEATVKILTKPALLLALEVFQGVKQGTQEDMEILKNPRVLQALRDLNSTLTIDIPEDTEIPFVPYDQRVVDTIKKEGSERGSVKRKIESVESFAALLKPPKKKKGKQEPDITITETCGSPNKGTVSTRETSKSEMKAQASFHAEIMKKGDDMLKKKEPKSQKEITAVFESVSSIIEIIETF